MRTRGPAGRLLDSCMASRAAPAAAPAAPPAAPGDGEKVEVSDGPSSPSGEAAASAAASSSLSDTAATQKSAGSDAGELRSKTSPGSLTLGLEHAESACKADSSTHADSPKRLTNRKSIRRVSSAGQVGMSPKKTTPKHNRRSTHDLDRLKTEVRERRHSLKSQRSGGNTLIAEKNVNFAPIDGTKFHEALEITLQREQEGNNKYRIVKRLKKYRGMRSDSKAENRARKQKKRIAKRRRKGQKQKTKDIIHKQHEQYALTYGMMLGVQMSVGRQYEFSVRRAGDSNAAAAAAAASSTTSIAGSDYKENRSLDTKAPDE